VVSIRIPGPIVEDTATSGGSMLDSVDAIAEFGCEIVAASLLLDRGGEVGAALEARGIPYRPVLLGPDVLDAPSLDAQPELTLEKGTIPFPARLDAVVRLIAIVSQLAGSGNWPIACVSGWRWK